jgi:hypothetical protein
MSMATVSVKERSRGYAACGFSARISRAVRFPTHTVFAMSYRSMEAGLNDTMHIILSGLFSLCVFAAIALSAVAFKGCRVS